MALTFWDGFDEYSTAQISRYWTIVTYQNGPANNVLFATTNASNSVQTGPSFGRNSTNGMVTADSQPIISAYHQFPATTTTATVGFAFQWGSIDLRQIIMAFAIPKPTAPAQFFPNTLVGIALTSVGAIQLVTAGIGTDIGGHVDYSHIVATSTFEMIQATWYYIEVAYDTVAGSLEVRVNGQMWLTSTDISLQTDPLLGFMLGMTYNGGQHFYYDDVRCSDDTTFLGDCRVCTLLPEDDGPTVDWTRGGTDTGFNFSQVNENPADDGVTYVFTVTVGKIDLYDFPPLPIVTGEVLGVETVIVADNDTSGVTTIQAWLSSTGTTAGGATLSPTSGAFIAFIDVWLTDPHTSAQWDIAGVNAAFFGEKRLS